MGTANTKTEICNMALSHLGSGEEIKDFDNEPSEEAKACRRFYQIALDFILESQEWAFAYVKKNLQLITSNPNDEWNYAYRYPADCHRLIKIWSGSPTDTTKTKIDYKVGNDPTGRIIFTNQPTPVIEYVKDVSDGALMKATFKLYFSSILAAFIAPRLPGIGTQDLRLKMFQLAATFYNDAVANDKNEDSPPIEQTSGLEKARKGIGTTKKQDWSATPAPIYIP